MRLLMFWLLALITVSPVAAKPRPEFRDISGSNVFDPRPDRAYLLMRVKKSQNLGWIGPMWLRIPHQAEVEAYDAAKRIAFAKARSNSGSYEDFNFQSNDFNNFYAFDLKHALVSGDTLRTVLVEAAPGVYVLAGGAWTDLMTTCFCLGTVQFEAKAGILTDLGTFLYEKAADPSLDPELAAVTNLGSIAKMDYFLGAGAVRPAANEDSVPAVAAGLPRVLADYRAARPFVLRAASMSNSLAPLPGVLQYRRGEVFDVKSGQILPGR